MKIRSHTLLFKDFNSKWYKKWAKELKQDKDHLDNHVLRANKFWQNAIIVQALWERGTFYKGACGIGFGVGKERLPSLFAKLGINVTATDQNSTTTKSEIWAKHELATGVLSLNKLGICNPKIFAEKVEYMSVDMTKIPMKLRNTYDFLWSNCSLGHLGTTEAGLNFIRSSLECLKKGGVAVHTTELNVLSDDMTIDNGSTVVFRLQDINNLFRSLTRAGYICSPLKFFLGRDQDDFRLSMQPTYGNDYSKIQVGGYISTQAVLIIRRPKHPSINNIIEPLRLYMLSRTYKKGLAEIKKFSKINPVLKQLLASQNAPLDKISIKPLNNLLKVNISTGQTKVIFIEFRSNSAVNLYSFYGHLINTPPVVLATDNPRDHESIFADNGWVINSKNRPSSDLWVKNDEGKYCKVDRILPQQTFAFKVRLNASGVAKGSYLECFSIVQEGYDWVKETSVNLQITVI